MNNDIKIGDWIKIKTEKNSIGIDGYVFYIHDNNILSIGYYQNNSIAIKEDVIWDLEGFWKFKHKGPNGLYLKGKEKKIVERGPYV